VKNGNETDIDCGSGPTGVDTGAAACKVGKACLLKADCEEADCVGQLCSATSADGFKNGTETDVDCGGGAPTNAARCAVGQKCTAHADCVTAGCIRDGAKANTCAEAPSCASNNGGQTCGAGEVGSVGPTHESCCRSLPVPAPFEDRLHPGKKVYLDKYEITAGRMREFITQMSEQYGGEPKIKTWLLAHKPPFWNDGADDTKNWTRWLPEGRSTVVTLPRYNTFLPPAPNNIPVDGPTGNVGTDWILGPAGWYFYTHGHNCDGGYGYPTYWYPENEWDTRHGGDSTKRMSRQELDVRSLNCAPPALLAAFCAWDGGQLATVSVLQSVTGITYANRARPTCTVGTEGCGTDGWFYGALGRFGVLTEGAKAGWCANQPGCATAMTCPGNDGCAQANYGNDAGQLLWGPRVPYYHRPGAADDPAARIASPGRMTGDVLRIEPADEPWMDMRGNLQELSLDDRTAGVYAFGGVHYDSIGRRGKGATQQIQPELKIAQAGGRCMRFRD
jgi:hypothetical protein